MIILSSKYKPIYFYRCFPHIVNLACKAMLKAVAKLDYDDSLKKLRDIIHHVSF